MRLTRAEVLAVIDVLNERLAGDVRDLRDALGMSMEEAENTMKLLESAVIKLGRRKR